jgi:hypothetical protein
MTCAVNLLPECCHHAQRRAVRRNAWTVVATAGCVLLLCAWVASSATSSELARLDGELGAVYVRQSELDRQLALATIMRNQLIQRGRALLALQQQQAVPEQLLTLSSRAPAGVILTEIRAAPAAEKERAARHRPASSPVPSAKTGAEDLREGSPALVVHICGYALEHDDLTRLIDVLQSAEDGWRWRQVELLRAAREPYRNGEALAFQLECQQPEGAP